MKKETPSPLPTDIRELELFAFTELLLIVRKGDRAMLERVAYSNWMNAEIIRMRAAKQAEREKKPARRK